MRTTIMFLEVFILGLLAASSVEFQSVQAQYADDGRLFPLASPIRIISPTNSTYNSGPLRLDVSFKLMLNVEKTNITLLYSVDGNENATAKVSTTFVPLIVTRTYENGTTENVTSSFFSYYVIKGWADLPELAKGSHNITVYGEYYRAGGSSFNVYDNRTVFFTVDDGNPPVMSNLSIENKTYSQENLPLNFIVDQPTSWMGYCLDGQTNLTLTENSTLTQLRYGSHTITIYANDTVGNMGSSIIIGFNIAEPFPATLVLPSAGVVAIGVLGFSEYFKKTSKIKSR